jgi:two-component system, OmpR family, KDP operon response regulator KdpE
VAPLKGVSRSASLSDRVDCTVLVVDDEVPLQRILRIALDARGYRVRVASNGRQAVEAVAEVEPDVVMLDLGLPDMDGIDVCRHLRRWSSAPIIVLTADGEEERMVRSLEEGADDYVTKPFSMPALLARVAVAARHRRALAAIVGSELIEVGTLRIDVAAHVATVDDRDLRLPRKAFALLVLLARNAGGVMTHRALINQLWTARGDDSTQPLRTHISLLRRALGTGAGVPTLVSESGVGYRLVRPD